MSATTAEPLKRELVIVGAGIIGRTAAWWLQRRGHQVNLIAPEQPGPREHSTNTALADLAHGEDDEGSLNGSSAALGLLMAQVFHRASGRAWRLRQRSLALWVQWIAELRGRGYAVEFKQGLLLLAASPDELSRQTRLVEARTAMGLPLSLWSRDRLAQLDPQLPDHALGGVWSAHDGQIDPLPLLEALRLDAARLGARTTTASVRRLRRTDGHQWQLELADGTSLRTAWLVICAGAGSAPLLADLGLSIPLLPVLGQAVELAPAAGTAPWAWGDHWPAAAVWEGINLVPRPAGRLWLGATLEPGATADPAALQRMICLNGRAPSWLHNPTVLRRWQGLRMQPQGRGAPWLEQLAPGLLLAAGHYRNGVLLAPASAEWLADALETS